LTRCETIERDVRIEIELLGKLHGDDALSAAQEKACRPTNRTARRKAREETAPRPANQAAPGKESFFIGLFMQTGARGGP